MKTHKKPTQAAVILRHLKKHRKGITSMDAFTLYGITRLAARIAEIDGQLERWILEQKIPPAGEAKWVIITRHREKTASGATVTRYKLAR